MSDLILNPEWEHAQFVSISELRECERKLEVLNRGNANAERILCEAAGVESGRDVLDWIVAAKDHIKRLEEALQKIANQDYRGNRSTESQIAFRALEDKP